MRGAVLDAFLRVAEASRCLRWLARLLRGSAYVSGEEVRRVEGRAHAQLAAVVRLCTAARRTAPADDESAFCACFCTQPDVFYSDAEDASGCDADDDASSGGEEECGGGAAPAGAAAVGTPPPAARTASGRGSFDARRRASADRSSHPPSAARSRRRCELSAGGAVLPAAHWHDGDATTFLVRSASYLTDKRKARHARRFRTRALAPAPHAPRSGPSCAAAVRGRGAAAGVLRAV
jgi:hypothetical protein